MPLPRLFLLTRHQLSHRLRRTAVVAASVKQEEILWTRAPVSVVEPAAESLFHVSIDLTDSPGLAASYVSAGQYLQVRAPECRPAFLAIASPPSTCGMEMEFLIKDIDGSAASLICRLRRGDVVEIGPVMGKGFNISEISPPESFSSVLIFATGSGIRSDPLVPNFLVRIVYDLASSVRLTDHLFFGQLANVKPCSVKVGRRKVPFVSKTRSRPW